MIAKGSTPEELDYALQQIEDSLNIGDEATLHITSYEAPSQTELEEAYSQSVANGMHMSRFSTQVINGLSVTSVTLRKGSPIWWAALILPATIIIGMITFAIAGRAIKEALMPILLVGGGIAVVIIIAAGMVAPKAAKAYETIRR